jgi:NDP-hexose-3-ketoreductase
VYPIRAAQLFLDGELTVRGAARTLDPVTGVDLAGSALLASSGGAVASVQFGFQHHYRNAYELWGSAGRITVDRVFTPPGTWAPIIRVERPNDVEELVLPAEDQFLTVVTAFGATVRQPGSPTLNDGAAMLRQARLVDAVRGAATGAAPDDPA